MATETPTSLNMTSHHYSDHESKSDFLVKNNYITIIFLIHLHLFYIMCYQIVINTMELGRLFRLIVFLRFSRYFTYIEVSTAIGEVTGIFTFAVRSRLYAGRVL